jgi:hypothetical protein
VERVGLTLTSGEKVVLATPDELELDASDVAAALRGEQMEPNAHAWVSAQGDWLPIAERTAWVRREAVAVVSLIHQADEPLVG